MWGPLAVGVVVLHAAYLVYQALGGLLAFRHPRWLLPHVVAVGWGVIIVAMHWKCPLTALEKTLRSQAGEPLYSGSFLDHYVFGTYLPHGSQPWVYGLHLLLIAAVYLLLARRWVRAQSVRFPAQSRSAQV